MEFKEATRKRFLRKVIRVDIGTEWNLKLTRLPFLSLFHLVDIGTEWNLKIAVFV